MIKNVLENINGVGLYGIISVGLFFIFFVGMLVWAFRLKKNYLNSMRELPLDDGAAPNANTERLSQPDSRHE